MSSAKKSNPSLWKSIVARVKSGSKGGDAGEWSARKAQLAVSLYKKAGGGYSGAKEATSLSKWTKQNWRTKSGKPSSQTGERYLPEKAIKSLSPAEYAATTRAKREGAAKGKQFVAQPKYIAKKTAKFRK
jgi:hypothetical protein